MKSGTFNMNAFNPPVGFRTYICVDCLTGAIDPIPLSDFRRLGFAVFKPGHICKQEDLEIRKRRAEKELYVDVIKKWDGLRLLSIRYLANIVHQWVGPNKDIHMKVIEESDPDCRFFAYQPRKDRQKSLGL
jgi:hypothetical protein